MIIPTSFIYRRPNIQKNNKPNRDNITLKKKKGLNFMMEKYTLHV